MRDELEFVLGGKDADLIYKHLNCETYAEDVLKQYSARLTPYGNDGIENWQAMHHPDQQVCKRSGDPGYAGNAALRRRKADGGFGRCLWVL